MERVRVRLQGAEVAPGLTAPQQVIKAVNEELVELLGGNSEGLRYAPAPPTVIMLVGLVKKNGIIMVDFAVEASRTQGKNAFDAIYEACIVRFRPIMMTTMAALFGTLPIALGFGAGAESRRPLGLAVVGGLLFPQMLTLFVTPVIYTYMDSFQTWLQTHSWRKRRAPAQSVPQTT